MTNLSITTHNNLFASKHYVRGPLQAARGTHTLVHLRKKKHTHTNSGRDGGVSAVDGRVLLTRPGWTRGSSTGCRTSAW